MKFNFCNKKIKQEKSLGEYLRFIRVRKKFNLEQVEKETRVNMKYLKALEADNFSCLPPDVYTIGFIRRYSKLLQIDSEKMVIKYHREMKIFKNYGIFKVEQKKKLDTPLKPQRSKKWLKDPGFVVTPKLIMSTAVLLLVVGVLSYIWFQVRSFAAAPGLEIFEPKIEEIVRDDKVKITGKTDPTAYLTVNNEFIAINTEGNFECEVKLEPGLNNVDVISKNKNEKNTRRTLKILAEYDK